MSTYFQDSLAHLLLEYNDLDNLEDLAQIKELIASAHTGSAHGANHFIENTGQAIQPGDLKSYLRCYPMTQALVAVMKHYDLNRDTQMIRNIIDTLLDSLEDQNKTDTVH